jgi:hypothetical protein
VVETVWDIANIGIGIVSFGKNVAAGNVSGAALDAVGVVADTVAAVLPGVPAFAGATIKTARAGETAIEAVDAGRKADAVGDAVTGASTKTDRLKEHLTNRDLDAVRREAAGEVVRRKADGTPFDHVREVREAQQGLLNRIEQINNRLGNLGTSAAERAQLQRELGEASRLLDRSEEYLPR